MLERNVDFGCFGSSRRGAFAATTADQALLDTSQAIESRLIHIVSPTSLSSYFMAAPMPFAGAVSVIGYTATRQVIDGTHEGSQHIACETSRRW